MSLCKILVVLLHQNSFMVVCEYIWIHSMFYPIIFPFVKWKLFLSKSLLCVRFPMGLLQKTFQVKVKFWRKTITFEVISNNSVVKKRGGWLLAKMLFFVTCCTCNAAKNPKIQTDIQRNYKFRSEENPQKLLLSTSDKSHSLSLINDVRL